ncbi:hypothetical protein [Aeromonas sp. MdU4]|uniref:hypothetical protein n=1 Tax=Aeromonas sp. MdU4 TaxID=3342819 RepID=UPI0035B8D8E0
MADAAISRSLPLSLHAPIGLVQQIGHSLLTIMTGKSDALTRQIVSSMQQIENSNRFICNNLRRELGRYTTRRV